MSSNGPDKNVKDTLEIQRVPDKTSDSLRIANFAYNYKCECFSNLSISLMSSDIERDYEVVGTHRGFISKSQNNNFTILNLLKSMILQKMLSDKKYRYFDLFWKLCDRSPSSIVKLYNREEEEKGEECKDKQKKNSNSNTSNDNKSSDAYLSLSSFWSFYYFTPEELEEKFQKMTDPKKIKKPEIMNTFRDSLTNVKIVNNLEDVKKILNTSERLKELKEKLKDKGLDDTERKERQKEVQRIIFGKPIFFYLFLFNEPHTNNIKWEDIQSEAYEEVNEENKYKATYILTAILYYHEDHYKVIIIHDVPVLVSPDGNVLNPSIPTEGITIIGLLYSHVAIQTSTNIHIGMYPFVLSSKNQQKEMHDPETYDAIYHHFEKIKKCKGFKLIKECIRFPAFYCYKSKDPQIRDLSKLVYQYDVYNKSQKIMQKIQLAKTMHSFFPLWAIAITRYLNTRENCHLRCSLLYLIDNQFLISFTHYLKDNVLRDKKKDNPNDDNDILEQAFNIVFENRVNEMDVVNYNDIFAPLEVIKNDREEIIYQFESAIKDYVKEINKIEDSTDLHKSYYNNIEIDHKIDVLVKEFEIMIEDYKKDIEIAQDFIEYQKTITKVHPYL